jgi:hypothetical protein
MEQLGSQLTDFHEIWYLRIFRKSVEKIQISLKSDKNKGHFTWRPRYIFIIFLLRMRNVSEETQSTHYVLSNFLENRPVYEKMWKNTAEWCRTQMAILRWVIPVVLSKYEYVKNILFVYSHKTQLCTIKYVYLTITTTCFGLQWRPSSGCIWKLVGRNMS